MQWYKVSYILHILKLNGFFSSDINECTIGTDNCDVHAVCTNTVGSFICTCRSGYDGDGITCSGKTNYLKVYSKKIGSVIMKGYFYSQISMSVPEALTIIVMPMLCVIMLLEVILAHATLAFMEME